MCLGSVFVFVLGFEKKLFSALYTNEQNKKKKKKKGKRKK